jgi:VTC domain
VIDRLDPDLKGWTSASLAEVNERAPLLDRGESKYVVDAERFAGVLARLAEDFDVLEINGRQIFIYETIYFDTDDLQMYRHHVQGRRRRLKIRSRRYVDSDLCYFEVKLKGLRDRTIKERIPYDLSMHGCVTEEARAFLRECVRHEYDREFNEPLTATLGMAYNRITLVGKHCPERVTADFNLIVRGSNGVEAVTPSSTIIVEVKSPSGDGRADALLRAAGLRPESCSKYCVGLNLVRGGLSYNVFNHTLRTHFAWSGPVR